MRLDLRLGRGSATVLGAAVIALVILVATLVILPRGVGDVHWETPAARLSATSLRLAIGDDVFVGTGQFATESDPGSPTYRTLAVSWDENDASVNLVLRFGGDSSSWWLDEISAHDGSNGRSMTITSPPIGADLGVPYLGEINLAADVPSRGRSDSLTSRSKRFRGSRTLNRTAARCYSRKTHLRLGANSAVEAC